MRLYFVDGSPRSDASLRNRAGWLGVGCFLDTKPVPPRNLGEESTTTFHKTRVQKRNVPTAEVIVVVVVVVVECCCFLIKIIVE